MVPQQGNGTRCADTTGLFKFYQRFKGDLDILEIDSSIAINGIQYFDQKPQTILAILEDGLNSEVSEKNNQIGYQVIVNDRKNGVITVKYAVQDEEGNEITVQVQGKIVRNNDNYAILWKYDDEQKRKQQQQAKYISIQDKSQNKSKIYSKNEKNKDQKEQQSVVEQRITKYELVKKFERILSPISIN